MTDYHTKPVLAVRVPSELQDWARAEAKRLGQRLGNFITGLLAAERERVSVMNADERRVWAAWNALPDGEQWPVRRIARDLGMTPADVAFIVYPAEKFGPWDDAQEPELPE